MAVKPVGVDVLTGLAAETGFEGPPGPQGVPGPAGPQGPAGADGADGVDGDTGPQGVAGPQGAVGPQGVAGPQGAAGVDGAPGADGPQGPQGLQGPQGVAGAQGPAGADGAQGTQGPAGSQGPAGAQGLQGVAGVDGDDGPQGPAGAQGPQGPAGADGPQGPQGVQGIQGLAAATGARSRIGRWIPIGNAATLPAIDGIAAPGTTGTATARNVATTNLFTSMRRLGYVTAVTAAASAGARLAVLQFWRGNAALLGGFDLITRFGIGDAAAVANARMFVGFTGAAAAIGNVEPTSLLNVIGVGCNAGATTLSVMHNDGAGAATVVPLGANFPTDTRNVDVYELQLTAAANAATVAWRVERVNTGHVASGTINTDLPAATQLLAPQLWRNNGVTALAAAIDLMSLYVETPN